MKKAKHAVHVPCHNHVLNLPIAQTSKVASIRNVIAILKDTISFFSASPKRQLELKRKMGTKLSGLCETRWIERHDGIIQFRYSLTMILEALDNISSWKDPSTSSKARGLVSALCDSEILMAIVCLSDILSCTLPLSRFFQQKNIDLKSSQGCFQDALHILQKKRENSEMKFELLFQEVSDLTETLDTEIKFPRKTSRQCHRANYPSTRPVDFYRQAMYIPLLDHVIEDLKYRFKPETLGLYNLSILFPDLNNPQIDRLTEVRA